MGRGFDASFSLTWSGLRSSSCSSLPCTSRVAYASNKGHAPCSLPAHLWQDAGVLSCGPLTYALGGKLQPSLPPSSEDCEREAHTVACMGVGICLYLSILIDERAFLLLQVPSVGFRKRYAFPLSLSLSTVRGREPQEEGVLGRGEFLPLSLPWSKSTTRGIPFFLQVD